MELSGIVPRLCSWGMENLVTTLTGSVGRHSKGSLTFEYLTLHRLTLQKVRLQGVRHITLAFRAFSLNPLSFFLIFPN